MSKGSNQLYGVECTTEWHTRFGQIHEQHIQVSILVSMTKQQNTGVFFIHYHKGVYDTHRGLNPVY
jgi:hypothetical protein